LLVQALPHHSALKILMNISLFNSRRIKDNAIPFINFAHAPMNMPSPFPAAAAPVRFGGHSAYAFDGDLVHLDAELIVDPAAEASHRRWLLQLWADAASDAAVKLAELDLAGLSPDPAGRVQVNATTVASLPAGSREHRISLLLAEAGERVQVCDEVSYPRHERFPLPHLAGAMAYRIGDGHIEIEAERIGNPRAADNLSGTLVLELWALPAAYQGGAFAGLHLGSTVLGTLGGQQEWHGVRAELPFSPLPEGSWNLVLMLREWTPAGYLTRDYCNFARPVVIAAGAPGAAVEKEDVAATPAAGPATAADGAAAVAAAPQPTPRAEAGSTGAKKAKKAVARTEAASSGRLSINRASVAELAGLKGLSERLAEGIVKGRPWASVDQIVEVKGIGTKLLDKLRTRLEL
jgi:DNA uptake protein ComE-like DNA-binding protein